MWRRLFGSVWLWLNAPARAQTAPPRGAINATQWKANKASAAVELASDENAATVILHATKPQGGAINVEIPGAAPGAFRVAGATQTEGAPASLRLDLQIFDANWKQLAWISSDDDAAHALAPSANWRPFARDLELPAQTAHAIAYFTLTGTGTAMLRDFAVQAPPRADWSEAAQHKIIALAAPVRVIAPTPYVWKNAVIGGTEYVTNILFNPKHPELMFSRNDTGGIYRYDRAAQKWVPLMDGLPFSWTNLFVADSLALDANHPDTLYVAAGASQWSTPFDVLKTTDGGRHWTRTHLKNAAGQDVYSNAGGEDKPAGERLAVDPNDSDIVLFGTRRDGLFRSDDGAKTWRAVPSFPSPGGADSGITFVTFDWRATKNGPTQTIYAGTHAGAIHGNANGPTARGAVYRSRDGGHSWSELTGGFDSNSSPMRGRVGVDGTLYVSTAGGAGLWKFQGEKWSDITPPQGKGESFSGIGIHPSDPNQLLTITFNERVPIFYSRDGGAHWTSYQYKSDGSGNLDIGFVPAWARAEADFRWPNGYNSTIDFDPLRPDVAVEGDFSGANTITGIGQKRARVDMMSAGREQMTMADAVSPTAGAPLISGAWDLGGFRHTNLDEIPASRLVLQHTDGTPFTGGESYKDGFQDGFALDMNPAHPDVIVIAGGWQWNNSGDGAISRDNGRTFQLFASKPFAGAKFGRIALGADPSNIVWAPLGTSQTPVYFSRDGGASWAAAQARALGHNSDRGAVEFLQNAGRRPRDAGPFHALRSPRWARLSVSGRRRDLETRFEFARAVGRALRHSQAGVRARDARFGVGSVTRAGPISVARWWPKLAARAQRAVGARFRVGQRRRARTTGGLSVRSNRRRQTREFRRGERPTLPLGR